MELDAPEPKATGTQLEDLPQSVIDRIIRFAFADTLEEFRQWQEHDMKRSNYGWSLGVPPPHISRVSPYAILSNKWNCAVERLIWTKIRLNWSKYREEIRVSISVLRSSESYIYLRHLSIHSRPYFSHTYVPGQHHDENKGHHHDPTMIQQIPGQTAYILAVPAGYFENLPIYNQELHSLSMSLETINITGHHMFFSSTIFHSQSSGTEVTELEPSKATWPNLRRLTLHTDLLCPGHELCHDQFHAESSRFSSDFVGAWAFMFRHGAKGPWSLPPSEANRTRRSLLNHWDEIVCRIVNRKWKEWQAHRAGEQHLLHQEKYRCCPGGMACEIRCNKRSEDTKAPAGPGPRCTMLDEFLLQVTEAMLQMPKLEELEIVLDREGPTNQSVKPFLRFNKREMLARRRFTLFGDGFELASGTADNGNGQHMETLGSRFTTKGLPPLPEEEEPGGENWWLYKTSVVAHEVVRNWARFLWKNVGGEWMEETRRKNMKGCGDGDGLHGKPKWVVDQPRIPLLVGFDHEDYSGLLGTCKKPHVSVDELAFRREICEPDGTEWKMEVQLRPAVLGKRRRAESFDGGNEDGGGVVVAASSREEDGGGEGWHMTLQLRPAKRQRLG